MDLIIDNQDVLCHIIEYSYDIQDWLNFMTSHRKILNAVYPKFIFRDFYIIEFYRTRLPKCFINSGRCKVYGEPNLRCDCTCLTTDDKLIQHHSRLVGYCMYKIKGFFSNVIYDIRTSTFLLNYGKAFDIFVDRYDKSLINIEEVTPLILNHSRNLQAITFEESYNITVQYIKEELPLKNILLLEKYNANRAAVEDRMYDNIKYEFPDDDELIRCLFCNTIIDESNFMYHELQSNLSGHSVDYKLWFTNSNPMVKYPNYTNYPSSFV